MIENVPLTFIGLTEWLKTIAIVAVVGSSIIVSIYLLFFREPKKESAKK